jgi:peptidyl-prolyl cis-trans isomerase C
MKTISGKQKWMILRCNKKNRKNNSFLGNGPQVVLRLGSFLLPFLFLGGIAACERGPLPSQKKNSEAVAVVNGHFLPREDFNVLLPEDYQRQLTIEEKEQYLDRWITAELLYEAAEDEGYDITRDIEVLLELHKKELVADRFVQRVIEQRAVVSEEEVRAYYDAHEFEYTKEFRVSHILVSTPEDAEDVFQRLEKKSFSWVARRQSVDKHTGIGGDLGFLSKGNMIPEFEKVVFGMEVDEVSDVIESDFGYHIIKVTDIRDARNKLDFEEAKDEIAGILMRAKRQAVYDSLITTLKQNAVVEVFDSGLQWGVEEKAESLHIGQ